jgi:hypothetical protein
MYIYIYMYIYICIYIYINIYLSVPWFGGPLGATWLCEDTSVLIQDEPMTALNKEDPKPVPPCLLPQGLDPDIDSSSKESFSSLSL